MTTLRRHRFADDLDSQPANSSRGFDPDRLGQDTVFVVRKGDALYAYRDACPHINGARMAWRKDAYLDVNRTSIVCAAHGARFEIETGRCTLGPCLGQSLERVDVEVADDGAIYLHL